MGSGVGRGGGVSPSTDPKGHFKVEVEENREYIYKIPQDKSEI